MLLGIIADDFTGASDIANTLAKGVGAGLRTVQFLGVPETSEAVDCEAGVISLKTRSIPADEAIAQSLAALRWLIGQGCRQFVFKYCSTFDSTPKGNIGPVGEALARELRASGVVACPAFPTMKRTVYNGHLFVGDRLLNESGLQNHPLNPMTDPDIRRWLALQCTEPVGLVPISTVRKGIDAVRDALERSSAQGERLVIVDAVTDDDLLAIGKACADARLITGGSGIALGLPGNFIERGLAKGAGAFSQSVDGPEAILAGSCSRATLEQISVHSQGHPTLNVDPEEVIRGTLQIDHLLGFLKANEGKAPLIFSSKPPDEVAVAQDTYGRNEVAGAIESLFAKLAKAAVASGVRRLVVAGGETSGAVVTALELDSFAIGPEIDPGVPILFTQQQPGLAIALKSGNFGAPDFFVKALGMMRSAR